MWPAGGVQLETGKEWTVQWVTLAINHPVDMVKGLREQFVFEGQFPVEFFNGVTNRTEIRQEWRIVAKVPLSFAETQDDFAKLLVGLSWERGTEPRQLRLGSEVGDGSPSNPRWTGTWILTPPFPLGFKEISWSGPGRDAADLQDDRKQGIFHTEFPISSLNKWQVAHPFTDQLKNSATIFLWRLEVPAFFEMHSHIQSNHCSPLPPAWVHVWEKSLPVVGVDVETVIRPEPSYGLQDKIAGTSLALGEGGDIASKPTSVVGNTFLDHLKGCEPHKVFPFLAENAERVGCLMPMDMEYMHFNGYFGIPISKVVQSIEKGSGKSKMVRWYCWDKIWGFHTNNAQTPGRTDLPARYEGTPESSQHGETWCWMEEEDKGCYEEWGAQFNAHVSMAKMPPERLCSLPFFHFDPRRYSPATSAYDPGRSEAEAQIGSMLHVLTASIQSSPDPQNASFFGYKLYTAMGWAPMDPFLEQPLRQFYEHCVAHEIPLINHGTPAGYYSHDRRHYFDLLQKHDRVVDGELNEEGNRWISRYSRTVPGPDGNPLTPRESKDDHWWTSHEADRVWWFTHHYVSAHAWEPVIRDFPKLKLALAHFADSDHLRDDAWDIRKTREPREHFRGWFDSKQNLTFAADGAQIDPRRTHQFLKALLDLIQPGNSVFVDLSYVILNEHNSAKFVELFDWARSHKPILLERILWGTDWPLIGNESPVTAISKEEGNMLHRYAKAFRDAVPGLPPDFFVRACFLNPLQFLDPKGIRAKLGGKGWRWIEEMDDRMFRSDFTGDKVELFYRGSPRIVRMLKT